MNDTASNVIDVNDPPSTSTLELRRPDIPVTLSELAALKGEAVEIIEARVQVLETLRKASIRATSPEDWLLFKAPEEQGGQVVGYLQDAGADRVRDLYGIEIFDVSKPEKVVGTEPGVFTYLISGSGRCKLTRQIVEVMEGGRSSTDDFCKGKTGVELELLVRKAARANLDGNITRELAGMKSVPLDDLQRAWVGTPKLIERCRRGRGFGTRDERVGGRSEKAPDLDPPICPHCQSKGVYRQAKGDRKAFWGCPKFESHKEQRWFVDAEKWAKESAAKQATTAATTTAPPAAANARPAHPPVDKPLHADEIFGREPGIEG